MMTIAVAAARMLLVQAAPTIEEKPTGKALKNKRPGEKRTGGTQATGNEKNKSGSG